jgi:hypothetical protein
MSFEKNDIIVRDDFEYPKGALVVDGCDQSGYLLAHPLGGGLQFVIPARERHRFERVSEEEKAPIFNPTNFAVEGVEAAFAGWTDARKWNGWAMPWFEFHKAQRVVAAFQGHYDPSSDSFVTVTNDDEEMWAGESVALPDGGQIKAYPVGAGSWTWEKIEGGDPR